MGYKFTICRRQVVPKESLACFDWLQWLGSGELASKQLRCNQSTISRNSIEVQKTFGIKLKRQPNAPYRVVGDSFLLKLERQVHQLARFLGKAPLRLHRITGLDHLPKHLPRGWCSNIPCKYEWLIDGATLLEDFVIDACIMLQPQVALLDVKKFSMIEIMSSPLSLATHCHNALSQESGITSGDLIDYSQLTHLTSCPKAALQCSEKLHSLLLASPAEPNAVKSSLAVEKVFYANALGLEVEEYRAIDFQVNFGTTDYLVILKENSQASSIHFLLEELRLYLEVKAIRLPTLRCLL
jgi:hypothetical protein